jgi:hypothetical protein
LILYLANAFVPGLVGMVKLIGFTDQSLVYFSQLVERLGAASRVSFASEAFGSKDSWEKTIASLLLQRRYLRTPDSQRNDSAADGQTLSVINISCD